ncbi:hypothetical protein T492DRAFT_1146985 [Pavlovales sp. CCMP2436]|nr:hypothetical protein T492DRAFT_1146985 [Pavlovales sp. CCMP2436]
MHTPIYKGVDLTPHIEAGITFSPTSTIHIYQGITFEGCKLYLGFNMVWDVRMLYVAVSRVWRLEQLAIVKTSRGPSYMGEGLVHRTDKARQFGLARSAGHGAIEEYPVSDGRYIADLAVFDDAGGKLIKVVEVVVTSPPSREKLTYYEELGIVCEVIVPKTSFWGVVSRQPWSSPIWGALLVVACRSRSIWVDLGRRGRRGRRGRPPVYVSDGRVVDLGPGDVGGRGRMWRCRRLWAYVAMSKIGKSWEGGKSTKVSGDVAMSSNMITRRESRSLKYDSFWVVWPRGATGAHVGLVSGLVGGLVGGLDGCTEEGDGGLVDPAGAPEDRVGV